AEALRRVREGAEKRQQVAGRVDRGDAGAGVRHGQGGRDRVRAAAVEIKAGVRVLVEGVSDEGLGGAAFHVETAVAQAQGRARDRACHRGAVEGQAVFTGAVGAEVVELGVGG